MTDAAIRGHAEPPIDQMRALSTAAERLHRDFASVHDPETIDRVLRSSYDRFAASSTIAHYLPLLAERLARQRLSTQAGTDHADPDGRPVVLFLCVHNAGRSQMALGVLHPPCRRQGRWDLRRFRACRRDQPSRDRRDG